MIYSLAPSEHINTGKTWPVYTVRLHALGRRACIWHIVQCIWLACNIKGTTWSQGISIYKGHLIMGPLVIGSDGTLLNMYMSCLCRVRVSHVYHAWHIGCEYWVINGVRAQP